jgi:hypothetical protein
MILNDSALAALLNYSPIDVLENIERFPDKEKAINLMLDTEGGGRSIQALFENFWGG